MVKYMTSFPFNLDVKEVVIEREPEKCIYIKGKKVFKKAWDSYIVAKDYLLETVQNTVDKIKYQLKHAEVLLEKIRGINGES